MIEETKRQSYLKAMGVTQWQLRASHSQTQTPAVTELKVMSETIQQDRPDIQQPIVIKGLRWLNQNSKNGLLVIFSKLNSNLSPESRLLLSKMLKSIHFLPAETGFAVIDEEEISGAESFCLESVKAILVLGHEAGRQLQNIDAVTIIPDSKILTLLGRKIVTTWHPDDLMTNSEHKLQSWNDLKQVVNLFNNN